MATMVLARRRALATAALALIVLGLGLALAFWPAASDQEANIINQLPQKSASYPPIFLANKDQPIPTNQWFSGLVFKRPSPPVFAYPWALAATTNSASLAYPKINSTPDTVFADDASDLQLNFNSDQSPVTSFDDLSVVLAYQKSGQQLATIRLTHGSPYVFVNLASGASAKLAASGSISKRASGGYIITLADKRYGLIADKNASVTASASSLSISAGKDKPAGFTLIALPASLNENTAFKLALNQIASASFSHEIKNGQAVTSFQLTTKNNQPTLFGLLPHQYNHTKISASAGSIDTLLGEQKFASGNEFSYSLAAKMPTGKIITKKLSASETAQLKSLVTSGIASQKFDKTDTYFAGKQLYRAANLLELAKELNMKNEASQIESKLAQQLNEWFEPGGCRQRSQKCFYYDSEIRGLVGEQASFGSQDFNDHEFHYGYFLYAASVLGRYDASFLSKNKAMVDLLASDIASASASQYFPKLRGFDAYAGHSWDDGRGIFADGNDQESSSEAVNAWYALYSWAQVSGNQLLANTAQWLYANEANAALTYWLEPNLAAPQFSNYKHSIVSLVWGGKLDYATFFSDSPAAKLGIQLIPMGPGASYLAANPARINQNLTSVGEVASASQFKDYLIMYQALADPAAAKSELASVSASAIDGANSLAYLYAWVYSR